MLSVYGGWIIDFFFTMSSTSSLAGIHLAEVGCLSTGSMSHKHFLHNGLCSLPVRPVTGRLSLAPPSFTRRGVVGDCSLSTRSWAIFRLPAVETHTGLPRSAPHTVVGLATFSTPGEFSARPSSGSDCKP